MIVAEQTVVLGGRVVAFTRSVAAASTKAARSPGRPSADGCGWRTTTTGSSVSAGTASASPARAATARGTDHTALVNRFDERGHGMEDNDTTARPASGRVVVVEMGRGGMLAVAVRPADSRASLAHAERPAWRAHSTSAERATVNRRVARRPALSLVRAAEPPPPARVSSLRNDARDRDCRGAVGRRGQGQDRRPACAALRPGLRYQGGPNAGHTIVAEGETYKIRQIPSGVIPGRMRDRRRLRDRPRGLHRRGGRARSAGHRDRPMCGSPARRT